LTVSPASTDPPPRVSGVGSFSAAALEEHDALGELAERRVAADVAGVDVRARIATLVDSGSFEEIGTFAHAFEDADSTGHAAGAIHAGDARVGGFASIGGVTVVVAADNPAVHDGTSGVVGNEKLERLMNLALGKGVPFVYLADGGRIRRSEVAGAEGLAELGAFNAFVGRRHRIPMVTAVLGDTTEVGALLAGTGDVTVLVDGARFTISDRAEPVDAAKHGVVDLVVASPEEALAAVARFIALVPSSAWAPTRRGPARPGTHELDQDLADMVPRRRTRAYDMRRVVTRLVDPAPGAPDDAPGELLELRPTIGRGLVTGLARIDGWPVGIFASNPMFQAGAMDPAACDKGVRLLTLCDAYQLPAIFLQDVAGFLVGRQVEHGRLLFRAVRFLNAIYASSCPTLTVVVRKAFGLAYESMNGRKHHTDGLYAWAGAEIGFMDPEIGVNVLHGDRKTVEEKRAIVADLREGTSPFDAAGAMNIDEVIDPAATRRILARDLANLAGRRVPAVEERTLRLWPTY
jgi:acetyl-CoA carboxylase carboxyltransferase component